MRQISVANSALATGRLLTEHPTLPGLIAALDEFHRQKIAYCYWKSSRRLEEVFNGEGDIDLLVARRDQHRAQTIFLERDFKLFPSVADRDHPATLSFLGYDEPSGRLLHVHLHFHVIVSDRFLTNYSLQWGETLLTKAIGHPSLPIRILDPASEAVLLVVRCCLEHQRLDLKLLGRSQAAVRKFELDRAHLASSVDHTLLHETAGELLNDDIADQITSAFHDEQALQRHAHLRRSLKRHCAMFRSYNTAEALLRGWARVIVQGFGRLNKNYLHTPRPWNRRAPGGGCMVALIGVDGSGKSTAVATMRAWLGSKIDVMPIYFGTGDGRPSLWLWPFKLMVPLITRTFKSSGGGSRQKPTDREPRPIYSLLLTCWAIAVALDKQKKLTAARRGINRGLIVLTDRYPQDETLHFNDSPLLTRLIFVPQWLRRLERAVYARARHLPPDLVIKLVVTPETAARREPTMNPAVIRDRIATLQHLKFSGARVVNVDAERPLPEVIRELKREIWRLI